MKCNNLFVYGTLMSGLPLHRCLEGGATYLGPGETMGVIESPGAGYAYPLAFKGPGLIKGEVYRVTDPELWKRLDRVEQGYRRSVETVCMQWPSLGEGVLYVRAYLYWYDRPYRGTPIPSGDWRLYLEERKKGESAPCPECRHLGLPSHPHHREDQG